MLLPTVVALIYGETDVAWQVAMGGPPSQPVPALWPGDILSRPANWQPVKGSPSWVCRGSRWHSSGTLPYLLTGEISSFTGRLLPRRRPGIRRRAHRSPLIRQPSVTGSSYGGALTQWLGGMGIIILSIAILPLLGIGGVELARAEAPGVSPDRLTPAVQGDRQTPVVSVCRFHSPSKPSFSGWGT